MTITNDIIKSSITVRVSPYGLLKGVDDDKRYAHINKYGPVNEGWTSVQLIADTRVWIAIGATLLPDGTLLQANDGGFTVSINSITDFPGTFCPKIDGAMSYDGLTTGKLASFLRNKLLDTGKIRDSYDITDLLAGIIANTETVVAARKAAAEEESRRCKLAEETAAEYRRVQEAAKDAINKATHTWIAEYGSDYLKRCVAEGIDCQRRYVQERMETDCPLWRLDTFGVNCTVSNPSEEAFVLLDKARETIPDATLIEFRCWPSDIGFTDDDSDNDIDDDGDDNGDGDSRLRYYAAQATFLGRNVIFKEMLPIE